MKVKAIEGSRCPMEGNPRKYITDSEAVEVPATSYYQRLVTEGSLVEEAAAAEKAPAKKV